MNSSNSAGSQKKIKILDDKFEKLISKVIQNQKKNNLLNKSNFSKKKIFSNNSNNNFISNNNNNIKDPFNMNNFTNVNSNKIYKENSDKNSINLINNLNPINFENLNIIGSGIKQSNPHNSNNFFTCPTSITTNNINNFHIINSNGPYIFPITQNITNYGSIVNHPINTFQNIPKGNFQIQNENFNIITDENLINNSNSPCNIANNENKNRENKLKKSLITSESDISKNTLNIKKDKFLIKNNFCRKRNDFNGKLRIKKDSNKSNNYKIININDQLNLKKIQKNLNNTKSILIDSYENLKIFDDKNNFIHDKNLNKIIKSNNINNVINNCNNYYVNNRSVNSNPLQLNGVNSLIPSSKILIIKKLICCSY